MQPTISIYDATQTILDCLIELTLNTRKLRCHQHPHTDNREDYSSSYPKRKGHNPKITTENHKK